MKRANIPYRITIELATGQKGKTIQVTGETPDLREVAGAASDPDAVLCAIAANALLWESNALAQAASDHQEFDRVRRALNVPLPVHRM